MKKNTWLLLLGMTFFQTILQAQTEPILANLLALPPYSPHLSDYTGQPNRLVVTLTNTTPEPWQLALRGFVQGDNGVSASTKNGVRGPQPILLGPGASITLTGIGLSPYFDADQFEFTGVDVSEVERSGLIPEGNYLLCVQALDYETGQPLSAEAPAGCSNPFTINYLEPPVITNPTCGDSIVIAPGQPLIFNWMTPPGAPPHLQYRLTLIETLPDDRPPGDALLSTTTPPLVEVQTPGNFFIYSNAYPPLQPGTTYAFAITAFDPTGQTVIENEGQSVPCMVTVTHAPTTEQPPIYPTITTGGCTCECSLEIKRTKAVGKKWTYTVTPKGDCTGVTGSGQTGVKCSRKEFQIKWHVSSGEEVAEIEGPADKETCEVNILKSGNFVLNCCVTVVCTPSGSCFCCSNAEETVPPGEVVKEDCGLSIRTLSVPQLSGKLDPKTPRKALLERDAFLPMAATGEDKDILRLTCTPAKGCGEKESFKETFLMGRVKFEWEIIEGEGSFVKLGCLPDNERTMAGDQVIFKPPYVPLPFVKKTDDTTLVTKIKLHIQDDDSNVGDDEAVQEITIKTKRSRKKPDFYDLKIEPGPEPPTATYAPKNQQGDCEPIIGPWDKLPNLTSATPALPGVPDNSKMLVGQWIVLDGGDKHDEDKVDLKCQNKKNPRCDANEKPTYKDGVKWTWKIVPNKDVKDQGRFILKNEGRYVIYEAPKALPAGRDSVVIEFEADVENLAGSPKPDDKPKPPGKVRVTVHRAGMRMMWPEFRWLPTDTNSVTMNSKLAHRSRGQWTETTFAHACRIHHFDFPEVSQERGICMNMPHPDQKPTRCRDLFLKPEDEHETVEGSDKHEKKDVCPLDSLFKMARTKLPVRDYGQKVHSGDFGAYGFLKSYTTILGAEKPEFPLPTYEPVALEPEKIQNRNHLSEKYFKGGKHQFPDNRAPLPYDVDLNHVADGGPFDRGGGARFTVFAIPTALDTASSRLDFDNEPMGDSLNGDGFTLYEEYRGFFVTDPDSVHVRTNPFKKDLFLHNQGDILPWQLFETASGLEVRLISARQFVGKDNRYVNFNFTTHSTRLQRGLWLRDAGKSGSLLGIALTETHCPSIPDKVEEVLVYKTSVEKAVTKRANRQGFALTNANYLSSVTAHELGHAVNVYHHGEFNLKLGPNCGDLNCVMRYSNYGTPKNENPGTDFCTGTNGTGANRNPICDAFTEKSHTNGINQNRGKCKTQVRVKTTDTFPFRFHKCKEIKEWDDKDD